MTRSSIFIPSQRTMLETAFDIYAIIGVLIAMDAVITFVGWRSLRVFTDNYSSIASAQEMDAFRRLAKINMYLAIGIILIVLVGLVVLLVGMAKGVTSFLDVGIVAIGFGVFSQLTSKPITRLEASAKSLPVEGQQLAEEYAEIKRKWKESLLPDW